MGYQKLAEQLARHRHLEVSCNQRLAGFTSYRIGGPAALRIVPKTEDAVGWVLRRLHRDRFPFFVLGGGSNVLIADSGWEGAVIHIDKTLCGWDLHDGAATVLAGTPLQAVVEKTVSMGLAGMESMAGIPGNIGGALRMNAGAFGQEIESSTVCVRGFYPDGSRFQTAGEEIGFGYRSAPRLEEVVITSARFRFQRGDNVLLRERMNSVLRRRAATQPLELPSCGSVFKRPPGYFAGVLIEQAGLKGERIGSAMVSPKHAGFIVNLGNASADDVCRLIDRIQQRVLERFRVALEPEVKIIGAVQRSGPVS